MSQRYKFNGVFYEALNPATDSGSVVISAPLESTSRLRTADSPGSVRQYTAGGLSGPRRLTLSGTLIARGADDIEDLWDDFAVLHAPGLPAPLYLDKTDRYLMAEVAALRDVDAANSVGSVPWEVEFLAQDPLWYGDTLHSVPGAGNLTLSVGGTAPSRLMLALPISAITDTASQSSTITITNTANGQSCVLWAHAVETLTYDAQAEAIYVGTPAYDRTARLLSGQWIDLVAGVDNLIVITTSTGSHSVTVGTRTGTWRDRWY